MRPTDALGGMRPLAPTQATSATVASVAAQAPTASTAAQAGSFSGLMQDVSGDVTGFIASGSLGGSQASSSAPALSLEGQAYLAKVRAAQAGGVDASGAPDQAAIDTVQQEFLDSIRPWAQQAGARLGVAPELVAAHAALESGWGQRPIRQGNGGSSYNLFGIKAGGQWQGDATLASTTEYADGAAQSTTARFRSYPDQASAFRDYTDVLLDNPRYRAALNTGSDARAFAQGLARGGYATDPAYADKLTQLAQRLHRAAAVKPQQDD